MTENEAIEILKENQLEHYHINIDEYKETDIAVRNMAIQALEKIQAYRAIGTVDEFKALKEKQFFNFDSPVVRIDKKSYDKAIDDFAEKIFYYCSMSNMNATMIRQIAEQLKGEKQ